MENITKKEIIQYLDEKGFKHNLKGFDMIVCAIEKGLEDKNFVRDKVTKIMYPEIAKIFSTTTSRTERAIKHAIEESRYAIYDLPLIREEMPCNSEFLSKAVDDLKYAL